jgi:hypothetical protein
MIFYDQAAGPLGPGPDDDLLHPSNHKIGLFIFKKEPLGAQ